MEDGGHISKINKDHSKDGHQQSVWELWLKPECLRWDTDSPFNLKAQQQDLLMDGMGEKTVRDQYKIRG